MQPPPPAAALARHRVAVGIYRRHNDKFSGFVHFDAQSGIFRAELHELLVRIAVQRPEFIVSRTEFFREQTNGRMIGYISHEP